MDGQILQQILMKLESIEDEQKEMKLTLGKLQSIEDEQKEMKQTLEKLQSIEDEQKEMKQTLGKLQSIEDEQKEMKQTLGKLQSIEDEQKEMRQTLGKLQSIEDEQKEMKQTLGKLDSIENEQREMKREQQTTNERLLKIESLVIDIPLVRQATLETLDVAKRIESAQVSFERKVSSQLHTHEFGIDILNREQLNLKTEIEKLKRR